MSEMVALDMERIRTQLDHLEEEIRRLRRMVEGADTSPTRVERTEHPHIVRAEGVCGGDPVIEGTRITVWIIAAMIKRGETVDGILEAYPWLSAAQVYDALAYYHDHVEEIEQQIAENSEETCRDEYRAWLVHHPLP